MNHMLTRMRNGDVHVATRDRVWQPELVGNPSRVIRPPVVERHASPGRVHEIDRAFGHARAAEAGGQTGGGVKLPNHPAFRVVSQHVDEPSSETQRVAGERDVVTRMAGAGVAPD